MEQSLSLSRYFWSNPKTIGSILVWLFITVILIASILQTRLKDHEQVFTHSANSAYDAVYEKVQINKTVLESFASLMRLRGDTSQLRQFTAEMRRAFPHIYTVGFQRYISPTQKDAFEKKMHQSGIPNYKLKDFDYENNRKFLDVEENHSYYATYFIEPMGTDADQVMGLDQFSVPFLKASLLKSIQTGKAVATRSFTLAEGGRGYVLYRAIQAQPTYKLGSTEEMESTTVSLAIKTSVLLAYASEKLPHTNIRLLYKDSDNANVEETYKPENNHNYTLNTGTIIHNRQLDDFGQPFTLEFSSNNGLTIWDLSLTLLLMISSMGIAYLFLHNAHKRHTSNIEREQTLDDLTVERGDLTALVKDRTKELEKQKEANSLLSQKIINVQEDEFRHIARELHDEFGQNLTAINTNAAIINNILSGDKTAQESSADIRKHANQLYDSLHSMMRRLRPETLDTFGLQSALEELIASFKLNQNGITHKFFIDINLADLSEQQTIAIYRCIQELLNNAIKHSNADKIEISISNDKENIIIFVSDNGKTTGEYKESGFGLLGIKERTKSLGGTMHTNISNGFSVTISFPIAFNKESA